MPGWGAAGATPWPVGGVGGGAGAKPIEINAAAPAAASFQSIVSRSRTCRPGLAEDASTFNGLRSAGQARLRREIKNIDFHIKEIKFCAMDNAKTQDWQALSELTRGRPIMVERVRLSESGIAVEGAFELPKLAQLAAEDQVFVAAFVRSHGSIKEMEQVFGVSYPTVKARLNRIAAQLEFVEVDPAPGRAEVLERLARGEIDAEAAIAELEGR
jgi:hypothetical protein